MKIALHDAEKEHMPRKSFPNYALMKISAYHKSKGDIVNWWNPLEKYDCVYSSKVFDFTVENMYLPDNTIRGGTGYNHKTILPQEIDNIAPDYSIYSYDSAIGFTTRGCPKCCRWCVVPKKEGKISPYRKWEDLVRIDSNKLVLMDNNILAHEHGINQLQGLINTKYKIDLNQGMDADLVTPEITEILAHLKWIKYIRFSCDTISKIESIYKSIELLKKQGVKPYKVFIYLLVTSDLSEASYRVEQLKKIGNMTIYAQAERNERVGIRPNKMQLEFANRFIYGGSYRCETWNDYLHRHIELRI